MKYQIKFRRIARSEFETSAAWYEQHSPGRGDDFEAEVEAVLQLLAQHPDRYPIIEADVRIAPVDRYPYGVHYRIRSGMIIVIAVFHQSRDPDEWRSRK